MKQREIVGQIIEEESMNAGEFHSNWIKKGGWESSPTKQISQGTGSPWREEN